MEGPGGTEQSLRQPDGRTADGGTDRHSTQTRGRGGGGSGGLLSPGPGADMKPAQLLKGMRGPTPFCDEVNSVLKGKQNTEACLLSAFVPMVSTAQCRSDRREALRVV